MIYEMMGWNFGLKYDITGKIEMSEGGRQVIAFDLVRAVAAGVLSRDDTAADEWARKYRQSVTVDMAEGITVSYEEAEAERTRSRETFSQDDIEMFSEDRTVKVPMNVREEADITLPGIGEEEGGI